MLVPEVHHEVTLVVETGGDLSPVEMTSTGHGQEVEAASNDRIETIQ